VVPGAPFFGLSMPICNSSPPTQPESGAQVPCHGLPWDKSGFTTRSAVSPPQQKLRPLAGHFRKNRCAEVEDRFPQGSLCNSSSSLS
jgi:hypothetical protein